MTWHELTKTLATNAGTTHKEAMRLARLLFLSIGRAAREGKPVRIPSFGTFEVREHKGRRILNPVTHEPMRLPKLRALKFHAAKAQRKATR